MQFDIKDKVWRSDIAPSAYQHRVRHGIEGGIDFHHGEMLRVPTEPICRTHLFWIPKLDEPGIRPTGCANENLAALFRCGCLCNHIATKSHRQRTQCDSGKIAIV